MSVPARKTNPVHLRLVTDAGDLGAAAAGWPLRVLPPPEEDVVDLDPAPDAIDLDISEVRRRLARLVEWRLLAGLDPASQLQYERLLRRERVLLGLDRPTVGSATRRWPTAFHPDPPEAA